MRMRIASIVIAVSACGAASRPTETAAAAKRAELQLTYLGVAGWQITDGHSIVLVDPFFSRQPLPADPNATLASDPDVVARYAPAKADVIVVGHSHVDHVLDAPAVALRTGAALIGSRSTARYALASGVPEDRVTAIEGGEDLALGAVSIRVIPSLHSEILGAHIGDEVPVDAKPPLTKAQFGEGGTFAYLIRIGGAQVLAFDTANFVEREIEGLRPDVAIVAPGARDKIHDYACRLMRALGEPPVVIATHFDAWQTPIATEPPLDDDTRADLNAFEAEIHACAPHTRVIIPVRGRPIAVAAPAR
jgi:L-ascorbate metabolism protein UlaG (beta-lactamase superfamily)